jgi:hypothetical protein
MRQLVKLKVGLVIVQIVAAIAVTANAGVGVYRSIQKNDPSLINPPAINFPQQKSCIEKDCLSNDMSNP